MWNDRCNGDSDIYAQRYSSDGTILGCNFRVSNTNQNQFSPDVSLRNNLIYSTWKVDSRVQGFEFRGDDIWANVLDWENPTGISDKEQPQLPTAFILNQNYPNPFNASTKISYTIPTPGLVILNIYDMLGREIKSIVNEFQNSGTYAVNFDASELSSGIYFYQLKVGNEFARIKKMMFLK